jgi:iron complex transport system permease protein
LKKHLLKSIGLVLILLLGILSSLSLGSVTIPFSDVISSLLGFSSENSNWEYIVIHYRLPKTLTAICVGSGLGISGLLMQTFFRNPLAGPYVLGLSSGASLGVALVVMGASVLSGFIGELIFSRWAITLAASSGSLLVMIIVLATSRQVKDTMTLLIIGLMVASLTSALVSVLAYFSQAEELQLFMFWSFGSLGNMTWNEILILSSCWLLGIGLAIASLKNLNALMLGESYAKSMGVSLQKNRILIITSTSLLAGSATAFAGPIAFIGLAVPHIVRQIVSTNDHKILLPNVIFGGALLLIICDIIAQVPWSNSTLPINAITSIFGAPVVIWLIVRKQKLNF